MGNSSRKRPPTSWMTASPLPSGDQSASSTFSRISSTRDAETRRFAEGRRYFAAAPAACSIRRATTSGWEMNATWLALTSLVLAFIRFA